MSLVFKKRNDTGFTLVETLVAISILLLVIIGPMTVAQKGIQNAYFASEQLTAVFLAQEAIESLRVLRDNAAIEILDSGSGDTWSWIPGVCQNSGGCAFDSLTGSFTACYQDNGCKLKVTTEGVYTYQSGSNSPFTRVVTVGALNGGGVPVTVTITWNTNTFTSGGTRTLAFTTWIYDHYQRFE